MIISKAVLVLALDLFGGCGAPPVTQMPDMYSCPQPKDLRQDPTAKSYRYHCTKFIGAGGTIEHETVNYSTATQSQWYDQGMLVRLDGDYLPCQIATFRVVIPRDPYTIFDCVELK